MTRELGCDNKVNKRRKGIRQLKKQRDWYHGKIFRFCLIKSKLNWTLAQQGRSSAIAERKNRFTIGMTRVLIMDSDLPMQFWAYTASTDVYLKNKRKLSVLQRSAYTVFHKRKLILGMCST